MIYNKSELNSMFFWDIETKPLTNTFEELPKNLQEVWLDKYHIKFLEKAIQLKQKEIFLSEMKEGRTSFLLPSEIVVIGNTSYANGFNVENIYLQFAPLVAEFAKIMCISTGTFIKNSNNSFDRQIITFNEPDEKTILEGFAELIEGLVQLMGNNFKLAGYNIREFDIPFTTKRFLINKMKLPSPFMLRGKKPWEVNIVDVCDDWRGQQREIVGLDLVCKSLGINTPKDKFKNSEVVKLFLNGEINMDDVGEYCEKDIHAPMDIVLSLIS